MTDCLPVSAIVATRNRSISFKRMLESLAQQSRQPLDLVVVDASTNSETKDLCLRGVAGLATAISYQRAEHVGAAIQRNQAMGRVTQEVVWLLDDDVLLEKECLERLWEALQSDPTLGGVNAMIVNQRYVSPGKVSRSLFYILHGKYESSYAGKCIGPALNLLPEDNSNLPEVVPVEWLNTTCTLYRKKALPNPLFPDTFTGYSMFEDVTLSITVGKRWKLANARLARIFHDSQPGEHKNNVIELSKMELVNRHYVMTKVLGRSYLTDYLKLVLLQIFGLVSHISSQGWRDVPGIVKGKLSAINEIIMQSKLHKKTK